MGTWGTWPRAARKLEPLSASESELLDLLATVERDQEASESHPAMERALSQGLVEVDAWSGGYDYRLTRLGTHSLAGMLARGLLPGHGPAVEHASGGLDVGVGESPGGLHGASAGVPKPPAKAYRARPRTHIK